MPDSGRLRLPCRLEKRDDRGGRVLSHPLPAMLQDDKGETAHGQQGIGGQRPEIPFEERPVVDSHRCGDLLKSVQHSAWQRGGLFLQ